MTGVEIDLVGLQRSLAQVDYVDAVSTGSASEGPHLVARILGPISVKMYQEENHRTPHVHVDYGRERHVASYAINPAKRLVGNLDRKYDSTIIISNMIQQCRNEIGLVCFGTSPDNATLWERYGGNRSGVCVELAVPAELIGTQLHPVQYATHKTIHIDQLMHATLEPDQVKTVYDIALLSKPACWGPEEEIRFVSKLQDVPVYIVGSQIRRLILGSAITPSVRQQVEGIVATLPYSLPIDAIARRPDGP